MTERARINAGAKLWPGQPYPLGATWDDAGVNFALFSEHATAVDLCLFDTLFTTDKPIIFAFHGYPWLIHRLTYRRTNHKNLHVRGYKEEGTTTTPFDMVVRNDLDRFHLAADVIDRVPTLGVIAASVKQVIRDKLVEHREYIERHGEDLPDVRAWTWGRPAGTARRVEAKTGENIGNQRSA